MSNTERGALAETMWRFTELMPWLAGADGGDPEQRRPAGAQALRRLQEEQQNAVEAHLAMTRSAVEHASQAASRLVAARSPMDALAAQAGFGLAMAELAAAPARAWLEAIPRLHACCMTLESEDPVNAAPPPAAEATPPAARTTARTAATRTPEPT